MTVVTRFAPSPTGKLHVGNIRAAVPNWLFAKKHGGRFILRLDDTDTARSREEYAQAIRADLAWLGLAPDLEVRQSDRIASYDAAFEKLRAQGRVYPCYESSEELEIRRKVQLSRGLPPVYDRAALKLSDADRARLETEGVRPHWRFRLDSSSPAAWNDLVRGETHVELGSISDPVVRRADGSYLYMLPSVVDDIDLGITHVLRGEDHVPNSGIQIQMFEALGAAVPALAHWSLITSVDGALSKRLGSSGVEDLRAEGIEPITVVAMLARLGTSDPVEPVTGPASLIDRFELSHFSRASARFDPAELKQLNARIVHQLGYDAVAGRLPAGMDAAAWEAIRPNLETVAQAADWWHVVEGPVASETAPEDRDYLAEARVALAALPWEGDVWHAWTAVLKERTGRKGKALFLPLRRALTGRDHGPEMAALLMLIGRERALERLAAG